MTRKFCLTAIVLLSATLASARPSLKDAYKMIKIGAALNSAQIFETDTVGGDAIVKPNSTASPRKHFEWG